MKKAYLLLLFILFNISMFGQAEEFNLGQVSNEEKEMADKWLANLYEMGVVVTKDSVHYNGEAKWIMGDSLYRNFLYPSEYSWGAVSALLERKALKPAFWYMINLYSMDLANRDKVLSIIASYDKILRMDEILLSTYYTYIAFDSEVCVLVDGKPTQIIRPDIAEKKLAATKEMVEQVMFYRKQLEGEEKN